jgi:septum site-determining protein MinC
MGILSMTENLLQSQAFKLKGRLYTFTVLQVLNTESALFSQQLSAVIQKAPKLFEQSPVVLDLSSINHIDFDLAALCAVVREHGIIPVAVQGGTPFLDAVAQCQGLAVLHGSSSQDKTVLDVNIEQPSTIESAKSKLVTLPVRSGQQMVAKGGDLVVTAAVSHGAELLADGNIHIYGALRGRALAGISGDKNARIFCQSLEAELLSIAGYYRLSDAIEPMQVPCQIYLENEHILIEPL